MERPSEEIIILVATITFTLLLASLFTAISRLFHKSLVIWEISDSNIRRTC
jgi:hypothetical protein